MSEQAIESDTSEEPVSLVDAAEPMGLRVLVIGQSGTCPRSINQFQTKLLHTTSYPKSSAHSRVHLKMDTQCLKVLIKKTS